MSVILECSSCHGPLPAGVEEGLCCACVSKLLTTGRGETREYPRRFGAYDLLERIDAGGMGVVYKARHRALGRVVALKMLKQDKFRGQEQVRRLHIEARAAAKLGHPHIIPLFEVGERRGRHFFTMRLIEGGSLKEHLPRLKEDQRKSAGIVAAVARAVHHAHRHGIHHRDLKPSNILLDAEDHPYVCDFGLARQIDDPGMTRSGAVLGTPAYMAPEQAAGKHGEGTSAADVYGLGALLYELLTGRPPFRGKTTQDVLRRVRERQPRRPRAVNRLVHRDLEAVCLKCLEKDPGERYPSAEELAVDLERFARDQRIPAPKPGRWRRLVKWARRQPAVAGSLAAAMVIMLSVTLGAASAASRASKQRDEAQYSLRLYAKSPHLSPVVLLMDTSVENGVYDEEIKQKGGTNADVLHDLLADLLPPGSFQREPLSAAWHNEASVIFKRPDLVVIHRSALFHAMNHRFKFRYPPPKGEAWPDKEKWELLYEEADARLVMFLGSLAQSSPSTKFLVYSRGTGGGWYTEEEREEWEERAVIRFPWLKDRITTMLIPNKEMGTFKDPETAKEIRRRVQYILKAQRENR